MPISLDDFKDAQTRADQLRALHSKRLDMLQEIERIYLLEDTTLPDEDWIKDTLSPDGRNKVDGARRLLTATEPKWSVPKESNTPEVGAISDRLERAAGTIWQRAGRLQNRPRHYDPALSGVLYGEVQMALKSTSKLSALLTGGAKVRAETAARQVPVLYDCLNPKYGYPSWDELGLNAYASVRKLTVAAVRGLYGAEACAGKKPTEMVEVWDYWNLDYHCIWVQGESTFLVADANALGYIPIVAVTCEGSMLFTDEGQYQTQPLLYTVWRSNLWKRQNLYMTIAASLVFEIGANPLLVYEGEAVKLPTMDFGNNPGGMIAIKPGEKLYPLLQKILDPSMVSLGQEVDRRFEASTIYSQTLGEPLGANAPFSMVHLLSQSGRLPLVVYQRMISFGLAQAMQQTFRMAKEEGISLMTSTRTGLAELKAEEIPDDLDLDCKLDISMPQDERMNVQIAVEGVRMGLFSVKYARDTYLNIGQSDVMDDEIVEEQFAQLQVELEKQKSLQPQAPAEQGAQAPAGMVPPGAGGQPDFSQGAMPGLPAFPEEGYGEPMGSPMGPGGEPPEGEVPA